jgi:hypothetical protein
MAIVTRQKSKLNQNRVACLCSEWSCIQRENSRNYQLKRRPFEVASNEASCYPATEEKRNR